LPYRQRYNSMTQRVHAELADRGHGGNRFDLALGRVMRDGCAAPTLTLSRPRCCPGRSLRQSGRPAVLPVHPAPMGDPRPADPVLAGWAIMLRGPLASLLQPTPRWTRRHLGERPSSRCPAARRLQLPVRGRGRAADAVLLACPVRHRPVPAQPLDYAERRHGACRTPCLPIRPHDRLGAELRGGTCPGCAPPYSSPGS